MIVRWLMALSEISFKVEFIAGVDNGIADSMSRLCRNNMVDSPTEYSPEVILAANIITKFKVPSDKYTCLKASKDCSEDMDWGRDILMFPARELEKAREQLKCGNSLCGVYD